MKAKLKTLVAVVALAVGAQAQAAIYSDQGANPTTGTGAGELFLSVIDRGGSQPRSYVRDLGLTAADFLANDASLVNSASTTFTIDANLQDLLTNKTGTIAWNIAAAHNILGPTNDDFGYLTTSPTPVIANLNTPQGFNGIADSISRIDQYNAAANELIPPPNHNNYEQDISVLVNNQADNAFYDGPLWGDTWHASLHSTEGALDDSLGFYFVAMDYTNDPSTNSSRVAQMLGNWSLSSAGTLTYTSEAITPIPVPGAVWLLGSALIGMVGVARRKSAQSAQVTA